MKTSTAGAKGPRRNDFARRVSAGFRLSSVRACCEACVVPWGTRHGGTVLTRSPNGMVHGLRRSCNSTPHARDRRRLAKRWHLELSPPLIWVRKVAHCATLLRCGRSSWPSYEKSECEESSNSQAAGRPCGRPCYAAGCAASNPRASETPIGFTLDRNTQLTAATPLERQARSVFSLRHPEGNFFTQCPKDRIMGTASCRASASAVDPSSLDLHG